MPELKGSTMHIEEESMRQSKLAPQQSYDADDAIKILIERGGAPVELDAATSRRLCRKIDWHLMPLMCLIYGVNYLDKTALSYASVMGINSDLNLSVSQYSWLGSIFYFGYLIWEYPTSLLLQRYPLGKYTVFNVIMWGIMVTCMAAVRNFAGALVIRFLLGVFEAAVTPAFALITSQWYTKREQGLRTSFWYSWNGFAQVFGGLLAYGIAISVQNHGSKLPGWRIIFLSLGLITTALGICLGFYLPDNQLQARFLTDEEKVLAIERIRANEQGVGNRHWKRYQFEEALKDPQTWLFFLYALIANIPNGGISSFFSLLIVSLGYTPEEALLKGTPAGAIQLAFTLMWGYLTFYFGNRILWGTASLLVALLGAVLLIALPQDNIHGRLAGFYMTMASAPPFIALVSLVSTNIAGYTKKTTVAAFMLIAFCAGNIIGPQTFRSKDAPNYIPAEITIVVCWTICVLILLAIYMYCRWQNQQKERIREQPGYTKPDNHEFLDLTDAENPEFIYTY